MSLNAGFEAGTLAATLTSGDRGDGDAWDIVVLGGGSSIIYDNAHTARGTQAAKITNGNFAGSYLTWSTKLGTVTDHYGRIYFYFAANPASTFSWARFLSGGDGGSISAGLSLNTIGKLRVNRSTDAVAGTMTNAIALNQWIRVEWHIVHNASTGSLELKLFNTATSSTPTETLTATAQNTGANADTCRFGVVGAPATLSAFWADQVQAGASAYPGAAGPRVIVPTRTLAGTARTAATARTLAAARTAAA